MFDCFLEQTVDILSILSACYGKVYITKPQTSRYANSEKYLVCKDFLAPPLDPMYPYLRTAMSNVITNTQNLSRLLLNKHDLLFMTKLEEYNAIFGQQQFENIHYTLSLIDTKPNNEKLNSLIKSHVKKCIAWCTKYNVLYNSHLCNTPQNNVFMFKSP